MSTYGITGGVVEQFAPGDRITAMVDEANGVVGGEVVTLTATAGVQVKTCTATTAPLGVAMHTAADDNIVTVAMEGVWMLKAAGAIAAGDIVVAAAGGAVAADNTTPDAMFIVGIALEAIADTAFGPVKLRV
jgi:hypothetical protein